MNDELGEYQLHIDKKYIGKKGPELLGFKCTIVDGMDVCDLDGNPLTKEDDVYEGREVQCAYWIGKIEACDDGFIFNAGHTISSTLKFAKDVRQCWVGPSFINVKALERFSEELGA